MSRLRRDLAFAGCLAMLGVALLCVLALYGREHPEPIFDPCAPTWSNGPSMPQ